MTPLALQGDYESNLSLGDVDAVTWGVFPGKEIAQPTIIEEESFKAWRDEAFEIWGEWEMLFAKETKTRGLLRSVGERKWLVTVVVSCFACGVEPEIIRSRLESDHHPLSSPNLAFYLNSTTTSRTQRLYGAS